jgi:predicted component of type VI protein secretion system
VLFYFKTTSDDVFSLDMEQLKKVASFRKDIQANALYGTFSNQDDLLKTLTRHLKLLVFQQWDGDKWKVLSPIAEPVPPELGPPGSGASSPRVQNEQETPDAPEEEGLLELVAIAIEHIKNIREVMNAMTIDADVFQRALSNHTPEMRDAQSTQDTQEQIRIYNQIADDMLRYESRMTLLAPQLGAALDGALSAYLKIKGIVRSELPQSEGELKQATDGLTQLHAAVKQTRETISGARDTILSAPPYTKRLRNAKRRLASAFDSYLASVTIFLLRFESIDP